VIAANGGDLISYDLVGGTATTIDDAPTAADVATVRDFVVILEPDGDQLRVQWSGFNDSEDWNLSGLNQAGDQPLLSGGKGVKIVGGENGIVLQKGAIKRMTYVGAPVVFQFDEISGEVGCMARGSVARVGQFIFFLSERGFHVCDRNSVEPIGAEKVDNESIEALDDNRIVACGHFHGLHRQCVDRWARCALSRRDRRCSRLSGRPGFCRRQPALACRQ
jgi:hypothetical protein